MSAILRWLLPTLVKLYLLTFSQESIPFLFFSFLLSPLRPRKLTHTRISLTLHTSLSSAHMQFPNSISWERVEEEGEKAIGVQFIPRTSRPT